MSSSADLRKRTARRMDDVRVKTKSSDSDVSQAAATKSAMEIAQERYRKFFTRSFMGGLMIFVFGAILYCDHTVTALFVVLLQVMMFREMIALRYIEAKERNLFGFRTFHWYLLLVSFVVAYGQPMLQIASSLVSIDDWDALRRMHFAVSFALYVVGTLPFSRFCR